MSVEVRVEMELRLLLGGRMILCGEVTLRGSLSTQERLGEASVEGGKTIRLGASEADMVRECGKWGKR